MPNKIGGRASTLLFALVVALCGMALGPQVSAQQIKGSYETTADVPLREGPGNFHKVVTTLPKGIQITVVGKEGTGSKSNRNMATNRGMSTSSSRGPQPRPQQPPRPRPHPHSARSPAPIARCARSTCVKHPVPILESSPVSRRTSKSTSSAPRATG
jgi:hypothetical protein